ncbi:Hace1 [Symbiodinium sp. CCMP2456]|nr:Hace1 [Symbiodinium sp. CCMP2456]
MSKTMGCDSRVRAEVSWALTGTTIGRLFLDPHTTVSKLKEMLERPAETPSEFLEILCDGSKLKDSACTSSFAASRFVALLALHREPPNLLGFLKEVWQKLLHGSLFRRSQSIALESRDAWLVSYIIASDRAGIQVNQLDTWPWDDFDDWRDFCGESCTALHAAVAWDRSEVCSVLLKHPKFIGVATANAAGQTVLHMAVLRGSPAMVEEILRDGRVDVNARTRSGDTALDLAVLIREHSADLHHARYERIVSRIAEHASREAFWDLLHEAAAFPDRRLLRIALGCRHGMDKFLAGVLVKGRWDTELLLSDFMTAKDSRCRKRALQKQKQYRKKQALLATALRKQKLKRGSTAADEPADVPKRITEAMSWDSKVCADVSWALTGATISRLFLDPQTTVGDLKEILEEPAKTPSEFLEILCDGSKLDDPVCMCVFAPSVALLAIRREPPALLSFLKVVWIGQLLDGSYWSSAAEWRDVKVAAYIVAADQIGVQVNQQDTLWDRCSFIFGTVCKNCTALHYAALCGQAKTCQDLLDHSAFRRADALADVHMPEIFNLGIDFCGESCTALHAAVAWGRSEVCSVLLKHPEFTGVATANAAGQTVLHVAVLLGWPEVVEEILRDGRVDVDARTNCGHTALDLAVRIRQRSTAERNTRYERIVSLILEHASRDSFFDLLQEAAAHDRRLLRAALECNHGMNKFLAGVLVQGRWTVELLLSDSIPAKDARCRNRTLQKQKECRKKQAVVAKALRKQKLDVSTAAEAPAPLPKRRFRTKASNSWKLTEFDFWC